MSAHVGLLSLRQAWVAEHVLLHLGFEFSGKLRGKSLQGKAGRGGVMSKVLGRCLMPAWNGRKITGDGDAPIDRDKSSLDVELQARPGVQGWRCLAQDVRALQRVADRSRVETHDRVGRGTAGLSSHPLQV